MKTALAARERLRRIWIDSSPENDPAGGVTPMLAPTDGVTVPHLNLPPRGPNGDPCVGFAFVLFSEGPRAAQALAPGFTVQIYRLVPTLGRWASFAEFTGYNYGEQLLCYDVGGGTGLYFRVTNASVVGEEWGSTFGRLLVAVAALS